MPLTLQLATFDDIPDVVALRNATSAHLTAQYGTGPWSSGSTEKGVLFAMKTAKIYIARDSGRRLIAMLALSTKKPWAIDKKYFSGAKRPLYLTAMAVAPDLQRSGIGRLCIEEARRIAREWPSDAIFLDAYDAEAGAGDFYRKCGFREVGRASYRNCPLIYFEMLF
jgi:GNAT superfamily N-acetyltransferase